MAKSIRSKRKREMRAIRREKFAPKELKKLKKIVENLDADKLETMVIPVKRRRDREGNVITEPTDVSAMEIVMKAKKYDKKTKLDDNGKYPVWWNSRKIKAHKKILETKKKAQKAKAKRRR